MQSTYDEINLGIDLLRAQFQKLFFKRKAEKSTKYAKVVFRFNMSIWRSKIIVLESSDGSGLPEPENPTGFRPFLQTRS